MSVVLAASLLAVGLPAGIFCGILAYFAFSSDPASLFYKFKKKPARDTPLSRLGLPFSDHRFAHRFSDVPGCLLHAWFIPAPRDNDSAADAARKRPTAVVMHGYTLNCEFLLDLAPVVHRAGMNCLLLDARSHGESTDDGVANVRQFSQDIRSAVDFLAHCGEEAPEIREFVDPDRIGCIGFSLGGSASIHAASVDKRVRFVVALGAFADYEVCIREDLSKLPIPLVGPMFIWGLKRRMPTFLWEHSPMNALVKIDDSVSVVLAHGTKDKAIAMHHFDRLRQICEGHARWRCVSVPGAKHLNLYTKESVHDAIIDVGRTISQ